MIELVTGNMDKVREYERFGLDVVPVRGPDVREADSDPVTVMIHKAIGLAPGQAAEDTGLAVEDAAVGINVKWLMDSLPSLSGKRCVWTVLIGLRLDAEIRIYRGDIPGTIVPARGNGFGFDPFMLPDGSDKTLAELDMAGAKDAFSSRRLAAEALVGDMPATVVRISDVAPWDGPWQGR